MHAEQIHCFSVSQQPRSPRVTDKDKTGRCLEPGGMACGGVEARQALPQAWEEGCTHCGHGRGMAVPFEAFDLGGSLSGEHYG